MELLESSATKLTNKNINFKKEVKKYLKKWYWFLLSMLLFYMIAKVYLRYAQPQYLSKTALKLQESKNTNSALGDMKNLGMGISGNEELKGETTVIVSKPILMQVAKNLNLDVAFFSQGKIKEEELYKNTSPLYGKIISLKDSASFGGATYKIEPLGNRSFKIVEGGNGVYPLNVPINLPFGIVQLTSKPGFRFDTPIKVVFKNIKSVAAGLEGSIGVALPENKGLLMELSMTGPVPRKSEDILDEVTRQYNIDGVKDKNLEAQNTQDFINDRLQVITEDLSGIENQKESFKRQNQLTDLETQASMALTNANDNTKIILANATQLEVINSIAASANSGADNLLPSGLGMSAGLESYISKYNDLVLTRNRVLKQATPANPAIIEMNKEISSVKNLIRRNLADQQALLNAQIAQLKAQISIDKDKVSRYPSQEKIFRSIERQQGLKEQLYLYLLQKREENAITLAVTAPKSKVVNPAYTVGQVKPNAAQITKGALALGFMIPLLLFFVLFSLDTKVHTKEHILQYVPDATIIAEIPVNENENSLIHGKDFSVFAESFRILSSNLRFLLKTQNNDGNKGVLLVTSSIKGEGKTTVAMNLSLTLASKSRVLIIGADIRNPQLHRFVDGKNYGLTNFLVSEDTNPEKYIIPSKLTPNLDVLFSGEIAPNPNDLLDMKKFDDMINGLRAEYDYIVIDSAPVMLVSDTRHLVDNADVTLYIVKSDYSEKEMMEFAGDFERTNKIPSMAFVLNSVSPENTRYGKKYGYGYYSYGAEELKKEKKFFKRFF